MSDIDTEEVDSLKVLDPNRPIREATTLATWLDGRTSGQVASRGAGVGPQARGGVDAE